MTSRPQCASSEAAIEAIRAGHEPAMASDATKIAWRFTRELVATRSVHASLYQAAKTVFGERGLVDMIHLIGIYLATSVLLNAFDVPASG